MTEAIRTSNLCLFIGGVGDGERRFVPAEHDQYRISMPLNELTPRSTVLESMQRKDSYYRRAAVRGTLKNHHIFIEDGLDICPIEALIKGYKCADR